MEDEKSFYIVNPHGCIHNVTREHARMRLKQPGYRMARPDEIVRLKTAGGNQTWDHPLAKPFSAEPESQDAQQEEPVNKSVHDKSADKLTIKPGEKLAQDSN